MCLRNKAYVKKQVAPPVEAGKQVKCHVRGLFEASRLIDDWFSCMQAYWYVTQPD